MEQIICRNGKILEIRKLGINDLGRLEAYLSGLSAETRGHFGPHAFDLQSLQSLFSHPEVYTGYIVVNPDDGSIGAYAIVKAGYLEYDAPRLRVYGLELSQETDCTFAPSVADVWQGLGVGESLFRFIMADLKSRRFKRIILWGGVQCNNLPALNYYRKSGFSILGEFEYYGMNYDMIRLLEEN